MSTAHTISLHRYLVEQERSQQLPAELRALIETVADTCKCISVSVNKGALAEVLGSAGSENVQGEVQKKLDIIANNMLLQANEWGGNLAAMASEELDEISPIPSHYPQGDYLLLFDPLDGSSNIEVNVSIGTIFSVLKKPAGAGAVQAQDFLQPGQQQVAAGYCIYGPQTTLALAFEGADGKPQERLIPFVSAYVDEVDLAAGRITVDWQPDY